MPDPANAEACPLIPGACTPCTGATPRATQEEVVAWCQEVPEWLHDRDAERISRRFRCKNYVDAMAFLNDITPIAEREGHHPDHALSRYREVTIILSTHAIQGLSVNDFVLAKLIDELWAQRSAPPA